MGRNREASIIVLVTIVIAMLHRRIAVESVVDVRGHKRKAQTEANFRQLVPRKKFRLNQYLSEGRTGGRVLW